MHHSSAPLLLYFLLASAATFLLAAILLAISCFVGKGCGPERAQIVDREGAKLSCGHPRSYIIRLTVAEKGAKHYIYTTPRVIYTAPGNCRYLKHTKNFMSILAA